MSQKTLLFSLFVIVLVFAVITWRGFILLKTKDQSPQASATTTINLDNLAISGEIGG